MSFKINEELRSIRDKQFEETKKLNIEEQIAYYHSKSLKLKQLLASDTTSTHIEDKRKS